METMICAEELSIAGVAPLLVMINCISLRMMGVAATWAGAVKDTVLPVPWMMMVGPDA